VSQGTPAFVFKIYRGYKNTLHPAHPTHPTTGCSCIFSLSWISIHNFQHKGCFTPGRGTLPTTGAYLCLIRGTYFSKIGSWCL